MSQANGKKTAAHRDLAFFGRITASVSHEINNVIAIVGELSGLLGDLCYGAENGMPLAPEKLKNISANIEKQVKRGEAIIKRLNRFAHSVDEPLRRFDVVETLENLTQLSQRLAAMKKVEIEASLPAGPLLLTGDPFALQQAVFIALELALAGARDENIKLSLEGTESGAAVSVVGAASPAGEETDLKSSYLESLMTGLGGEVNLSPAEGGKQSILLSFPGDAGSK